MLNKEIIIAFLRSHFEYLRNNYHIIKICLIGSFARDEQCGNSDIDILVEFDSGINDIYDTKLKLKEYLQSNLLRDIDICREIYLKPYVKEYLLKEVIYV